MIYCDVCEVPLIIQGEALDEDEFSVICPVCGYDNSYQFKNRTITDDVDDFMDASDIYDDDVLMTAMAERFGIDPDDLQDMVRVKEILGWDIKIRKYGS